MNHWVFVHRGESQSAEEAFPELLHGQNCGFRFSSLLRNKIEALQPVDVVIFHIGGRGCKYFAGEARLTSKAYPPTRESIGGPEDYKLDPMVSSGDIDLWNSRELFLTFDVCERLEFIKNKNNW